MGLYNEVVFTCPECEKEVVVQTKSGTCRLESIPCCIVPADEVVGLDDELRCDYCDTLFEIAKPEIKVSLKLIPKG